MSNGNFDRDTKKIKEDCKNANVFCPDCEHRVKEGCLKGMCGVRDEKGLTPMQWGYGTKMWD